MKAFQAIALAGLTAASISAQAGFISVPETVSFDVNDDPSTYTLGFTGSIDDDRDDTETEVPFIAFSLESENFYDYFDDGGFSDDALSYGLQHLFQGRGFGLDGPKERITGPVLGESYRYNVRVNAFYTCGADICGNDFFDILTTVTFFDGEAPDEPSASVPAGPTAPLLLAGLAGLWLRKRSII